MYKKWLINKKLKLIDKVCIKIIIEERLPIEKFIRVDRMHLLILSGIFDCFELNKCIKNGLNKDRIFYFNGLEYRRTYFWTIDSYIIHSTSIIDNVEKELIMQENRYYIK